jgi:cytochrome c peroxidase
MIVPGRERRLTYLTRCRFVMDRACTDRPREAPVKRTRIRSICLFAIAALAMCSQTLLKRESKHSTGECAGEDCNVVARGFRAFTENMHALSANGRACADCHVPADHFQLSPSTAEARYRLLLIRRQFDANADDPLFRPTDANDFRASGSGASDFTNLRKHGLIRIGFPLPSNVRLIDERTGNPSDETEVDVWRAVPPIANLVLTGPDSQNPFPRGPNNTGGYQRDGRFGSLEEQARNALKDHSEMKGETREGLVEDIASFERTVFSSPQARATAEALRSGNTPGFEEPPLTELETQGKAVFNRACGNCHGGAGFSTTNRPVVFRYHDTKTQCPRPVDTASPPRFSFAACAPEVEQTARTYEFTTATGEKVRRRSSDPGRALLTGIVMIGGQPAADDWNKLDVPGLHGIRHTAPYFHNNSATTLEEVVDHYIAFYKFARAQQPPGVVPPVASTDGVNFDRQPSPEERAALVAYLRTL